MAKTNLGPQYVNVFKVIDSNGDDYTDFTTDSSYAFEVASEIGGKVMEAPAFIYMNRLEESK